MIDPLPLLVLSSNEKQSKDSGIARDQESHLLIGGGPAICTCSSATKTGPVSNCKLCMASSCNCKASEAEPARKNIENISTKYQSNRLIRAYFVAELIGTFLLVIIGDGAVAAYVLTKKAVDPFPVCFAFGVGAMIATFASGKISGAHINPAATLAFALDGKLKWALVPVYLVAQYLGGFLAALVLFLNYREAINAMDGGQHSAFGSTNSTGGIFATYPADYVSIWGSLLDQIVGTAVLLFSICAVTDRQNAGLEDRHQPLVVAFVIGIICVAFSPNCGAIFNPARDLSPRLLTALFGYTSVWKPVNGSYWFLAGVLGPHVGAIIGVFIYKWLISAYIDALKIGQQNQTRRDIDLEDKPESLQRLNSNHEVVGISYGSASTSR